MVFLSPSSPADITDLLSGGTQIRRIYVSVCIQRLKAFQYDLTALFCLYLEMYPARQILPEINHSLAFRRHQHFPRLQMLHFPHSAARLGC